MTDPSVVASQQLPVVTQDDVAAEWSLDVFDPSSPAPIISAIQAGQTALFLAYQDASAYAAAQSDPTRATEEYADECGWERGVYRQTGEADSAYRARFYHQTTVDPETIVAAANAILAPFTSTSCVYFEHSDAWFVREDYVDIISASATTPIVVTPRFEIPSYWRTGSTITVSDVGGLSGAANGDWTITIVMGPVVASAGPGVSPPTVTLSGTPARAAKIQIQIISSGALGVATFSWFEDAVTQPAQATGSSVPLGNTGLTASFGAGPYSVGISYTAAPSSVSLDTSVGLSTPAYTGGGSMVITDAIDLAANPYAWSSHPFGTPYNTQNYPDRNYSSLPQRFSCGARAFSNAYGRIFWLVAPDISGIDANVTPAYTGYLDIENVTAVSATSSVIEVTTRTPLPAGLVTGATVTTSLVLAYSTYPATTAFTAAVGSFVITVTGPNSFSLNGSSMGGSVYAGGGSVQVALPLAYPPDGFFAGGMLNLPGQIVVTHSATGTLDASHTKALVQTSTGTTTVDFPASASAGEQLAVFDTQNQAANNPITVSGNGNNLEDPANPGTHVASIVLRTNGVGVFWIWNTSTTQWDLYERNGAFVWSIGGTVDSIYSQLVSNVDAIRGQGIRWAFMADPKLGN